MRRRAFFGTALAGCLHAADKPKKRIAGIVTEYRHYSHADVILGRILGGNSANNVWSPPRTHLVSLFTHQVPEGRDQSRDFASRYGFKIFPSIRETLTLGGDKLAVDGVIFVGEHGDYPNNEFGQKMYPRHELFSQILDVYEKTGHGVPTFFDKHLSYSWDKAKEMYDRGKKLGFPWMAGSSIPVTIRNPMLEIPLGAPLQEAAVVGYGPHDAYGFHLLETLQCMVERRKGGETGVEWVEWIEGDKVWQWMASDGKWSRPLLEAAHARIPARRQPSLEADSKNPVLFLVQYRDGFRAAGLILGPSGASWSYASRTRDSASIDSTYFGLTDRSRTLPHFDGLVKAIEDMMITGKPVTPIERTLLTTGVLAFLFQSKGKRQRISTPELNVRYTAPAKAFFQRA